LTSDSLILLGAGALAGMVGTAGGTSSLISYPALLAVGIPPLTANVTNAVAFVACLPGAALGSRPELRGQSGWLLRWAPFAALGAGAGAALLLSTPATVFGHVVPYLVAFASLALLLQPRISAWQEQHLTKGSRLALPCGVLAVSLYEGYWGAGAGVMMFTLLLLTVDQHLARANALKNMLVGVGELACSIGFVLFGPVDWTAVVPMACGLFVGGVMGPALTRRVPSNVLRVVVALAGLGFAAHLLGIPT
jgi:uncharacterized membrane protein YfcA